MTDTLTKEQVHDLLREILSGDTSSLDTPYVNRIRSILELVAKTDAALRAGVEQLKGYYVVKAGVCVYPSQILEVRKPIKECGKP